MQLCQTKALCILNQNDSCIWYINSNLDYCCRNKYLRLILCKTCHNIIFFFGFHFSMKIRNWNIGRQSFSQLFCITDNICPLRCLALFYHGTDHIRLVSCLHLLYYKIPCLWTVWNIDHTIFYWQPFCWKLVHNRNIKVSIKNHRQTSWNWCRAHYKHVRSMTFLA